jgi:uncharacterized protein YxjI
MPELAFPLNLRFKIMAVSPIIEVTDAHGNYVCYVKQKLFKLKERIEVFTDPTRTQLLCEINANKVIDFSATYTFTDPGGNVFGAVRRKGMRSLWRAHYEICDAEKLLYTISEKNPWAKVFDGLFGEIPILGIFAGYLFQPAYGITHHSGIDCYQLKKMPAFLEGKFQIDEIEPCHDDIVVLMALLMMTLLERRRG